jgi:hypothetical protein
MSLVSAQITLSVLVIALSRGSRVQISSGELKIFWDCSQSLVGLTIFWDRHTKYWVAHENTGILISLPQNRVRRSSASSMILSPEQDEGDRRTKQRTFSPLGLTYLSQDAASTWRKSKDKNREHMDRTGSRPCWTTTPKRRATLECVEIESSVLTFSIPQKKRAFESLARVLNLTVIFCFGRLRRVRYDRPIKIDLKQYVTKTRSTVSGGSQDCTSRALERELRNAIFPRIFSMLIKSTNHICNYKLTDEGKAEMCLDWSIHWNCPFWRGLIVIFAISSCRWLSREFRNSAES